MSRVLQSSFFVVCAVLCQVEQQPGARTGTRTVWFTLFAVRASFGQEK
jgi:hypothetical protein